MTFDLYKLARAAEFSFDLSSVGHVRCKSLTSELMSHARQRSKTPGFESKELARWLLGEMAKLPTNKDFQEADPIDGDSLTVDQLTVVTDQELESFSERLVQKNLYLVRVHEGEDIKRREDQSACDFLVQVIEHRCAEEKAQVDRMIQSMARPMFVDSTLDSIKKSLAASNKFEDSIKQYVDMSSVAQIKKSLAASNYFEDLAKQVSDSATSTERLLAQVQEVPQIDSLPLMHFPKNPILETNQILENLTSQIESMRPLVAQGAEMIRTMNDTALRMQADYLVNAERSDTQMRETSSRADRQTKIAIRVAIGSLIVSAFGLVASSLFSYQNYADTKSSGEREDAQITAFKESINKLVVEQRAERAAFLKQISDASRRVSKARK